MQKNVPAYYLENLNKNWQQYVKAKEKEKDVRYLLLNNAHFFSILSSIFIESALWWESPIHKENAAYIIKFSKNEYDIKSIKGNWRKKITNVQFNSADKPIFRELEYILIQEFFEGFAMDEAITALDTVNWNDE